MRTVGVDPDTHTLAVAIMDGPTLEWCWLTSVNKKLVGDDAVVAVADDLLIRAGQPRGKVDRIVIEQMCVYPDTPLGTRGINGLMRVAATAGIALSWCKLNFHGAKYDMPTAPEWKGQKSKAAHHRQILRQVDEESRKTLRATPAGKRGHLLDAVGMALWAQGGAGARNRIRKNVMADARDAARKARG